MSDLADFPVTNKWPAQHPDRIQLYSLPTPNGVKVSVMIVCSTRGSPAAPGSWGALDGFLARPAVVRGVAIPTAG